MILMLDLCSCEEFHFLKWKEKLLVWCHQYKKRTSTDSQNVGKTFGRKQFFCGGKKSL